MGSALFGSSVHPCKIAPHLSPPARVAYGGGEHEHWGRFDLLPINDQTMEWVPASHGKIPPGRRPVEGGYEENGMRLFHAIVYIDNVWVPGKTGEHLVRISIHCAISLLLDQTYGPGCCQLSIWWRKNCARELSDPVLEILKPSDNRHGIARYEADRRTRVSLISTVIYREKRIYLSSTRVSHNLFKNIITLALSESSRAIYGYSSA